MNEIICPHCKKAFKIDEAGYADILKQVHDKEFDQQLNDRLQIAEREKRSEVELAKAKVTSEFEKRAAEKGCKWPHGGSYILRAADGHIGRGNRDAGTAASVLRNASHAQQ